MNNFYFLEDFDGKVFWKAMNISCSKFLGVVLERRKPKDIQMIFSEVKDQVCMLMFHRFGSYVIQKLFQVCDEQQMNQLVFSVTANVNLLKAVCLDREGSESMKKFLSCLRTPEQISRMISIVSSLTAPLVKDRFGSGVISHCFNIFPAEETQPIYDVITDNFLEIATNENGYFLLLQLFNSKGFLLEGRPRILSEIIANAHHLSHDPFGYIVLHCVIALRMQDVVGGIVDRLTGAFAFLSINRYATEVVLELMTQYKEEYIPQIINEIISSPDFSRVLRDPYGKRILKYDKKYSTETICEILNHQISLHPDHVHSHRHGKNVLRKRKR